MMRGRLWGISGLAALLAACSSSNAGSNDGSAGAPVAEDDGGTPPSEPTQHPEASAGGSGGSPPVSVVEDASTPEPVVVVLEGGEPCAESDAGDAGAPIAATEPVQIVGGAATPLAITPDSWLLYRRTSLLSAMHLVGDRPTYDLIDAAGTLVMRGRVAFYFTDVDYTTNRGDLMIWSGGDCARTVGNTLTAEDKVDARGDGLYVLYADNVTDTTYDLMLATRDLTWRQVLVEGVGRGTEQTCRARYGFAGDHAVVGWCAEDSLDATLAVFELDGDTWSKTEIGTGVQPDWAADGSGDRIFYTTADSQARLWTIDGELTVDEGVSWGVLKPDGTHLYYLVGDQLRSTPLPDLLPIPLMTNGFRGLAAWSPTFDYVAYSTTVTFDSGEHRDLLVVPTDSFTANPLKLADTPTARLSTSVFTQDGSHVLYLEGSDAYGAGTLHAAPVDGGAEVTRPSVDTVMAAHGSRIVFSENRSDPMAWPIVADLATWDVAQGGAPTVLSAPVVDGRTFQIMPDGAAVVYERPAGASADGGADAAGIWWHPLPNP